LASQLVGIGVGGLICSRLVHGSRWYRLVGPLGILMSFVMMGMALTPRLPEVVRLPGVFAGSFLMGALGGAILVPMESFIQVRPAPERKGAVWSAVNFVVFSGILLSGLVANALNSHWRPTSALGIIGAGALAMSVLLLGLYKREEQRERGEEGLDLRLWTLARKIHLKAPSPQECNSDLRSGGGGVVA
jgi:predicted MFS family arabinose efflux permease